MRKIEQQMLNAIRNRESKSLGNTRVEYRPQSSLNPKGPRSLVYLFGNHIANYWHNPTKEEQPKIGLDVNKYTLASWPTNTTKSRLKALGANVTTKKGITYLNGEKII